VEEEARKEVGVLTTEKRKRRRGVGRVVPFLPPFLLLLLFLPPPPLPHLLFHVHECWNCWSVM